MENNIRGVRKGTWTKEEDCLLKECIEKYGEGKWHLVPLRSGLNRCRKSCRLRWLNYLRPDIKRSCFTKDEVDLMMRLHKLLGNKWSLIAGRLPGRTANDIKNFWNTHIEKKLAITTTGSGGFGWRGKDQKPINHRNILRPRPRTFSKQCPNDHVNKTTESSQDKNSNETGLFSSSSQKEVDECMQWWLNLLETTENGGSLPNLLVSENDHKTKNGPVVDSRSVPNSDADGWGFDLSLEDDKDMTEMFGNFGSLS